MLLAVDHFERMDPVGVRLLQRIQGLLATRPDLKDRALFGRRIGRPTPSWLSEFLNGKRTTNDLRLVIKIAKVFGVSVGFLLGENEHAHDEGAATILATYEMVNERDRRLLLSFAASLRPASDEESGTGGDDGPEGGGRTNASNASPRKKPRR
jgi:transcriptional regulator with XRE-family HTH domain